MRFFPYRRDPAAMSGTAVAAPCATLNGDARIAWRRSTFRIRFALNFWAHNEATTSAPVDGSNSGQILFAQYDQHDDFASLI